MSPNLLQGLNAGQREAVTSLRGPVLVLAGAGTGKTRVITVRLAALIAHGVEPSRILSVTFTNRAAKEMAERSRAILGKRRDDNAPEISTFHAYCVRVLRRHAERLGYPARFAIYDRGDQETIARDVLRQLKISGETLRPGDLLYRIGQWKMQGVRAEHAEQAATADRDHLVARAYRRYQEALQTRGAVDFDDLLGLTERLFDEHEDARDREARRFTAIQVDEYQDTNGSQYRILRHLAQAHQNLCVVGDDDQSIYGWRGAEVRNILEFEKDWPKAKVVRLEQNYRSVGPVLELANRLIRCNPDRHDKELHPLHKNGPPPRFAVFADDTAEAVGVVRDLEARLAEPDVRPRDLAILCRTNEQPRAFELELRHKRIPYRLVGGMSFWDRREIRDVLAYLRIFALPKDEVSLLRVLNVPARALGPTVVKRLLAAATSAGVSLGEGLLDGALSDVPLGPGASKGLESFLKTWREARSALAREKPSAVLRRHLERVGYREELRRRHPDSADAELRWNAVEEVVNSLARFEARHKKPDLLRFLQEISLQEQEAEEEQDRSDAVTLMTLHSAKGLEFPQVYLVGMEEGVLPHERSLEGRGIEEERRLCYVGITRARRATDADPRRATHEVGQATPHPPQPVPVRDEGSLGTPEARTVDARVGERVEAKPTRARREVPCCASERRHSNRSRKDCCTQPRPSKGQRPAAEAKGLSLRRGRLPKARATAQFADPGCVWLTSVEYSRKWRFTMESCTAAFPGVRFTWSWSGTICMGPSFSKTGTGLGIVSH